ncbi:hypothetical protein LPJ56_003044, partial [Coemansia sp. RSA 2599]
FHVAEKSYMLTIRQQPERSRVGSISEKMDRRPIDPPPIIQLVVHDPRHPNSQSYTTSPALFMQVILMDDSGTAPVRYLRGHKAAAMAGSMVSPLHTLRDASTRQGAYFVFSDLSVRLEGQFRLRFDLYETEGEMVHRRASIISDVFSVHSPKRFPGMMESTRLSKLFAEQGVRIRIRTEAGTKKRGRKPCGETTNQSAALLSPPPSVKRARTAKGSSGVFRKPKAIDSNTLQHELFSACHSNKENVPPGADSCDMIHYKNNGPGLSKFEERRFGIKPAASHAVPSEPLCMPRMGRPAEHHRIQHSLSLSDMAAVALLDSLSNGNRNARTQTPPMATDAEISRLLEPNGCLGQNYLAPYSASSAPNLSVPLNAMIADIGPQVHSQQMPIMGTFDTSAAPLSSSVVGPPFSNYRIASFTRTPETFNGSGMFVDTAPRLHPTLRSSASSGGNSEETPVSSLLQIPQRLYTSQMRITSLHGPASSRAGAVQMPFAGQIAGSAAGSGWGNAFKSPTPNTHLAQI